MENVWDALKKIEADAEQIRIDAQTEAKAIIALGKQDADKLVANGQTYADEEAQQLYSHAVEEANRSRDEQLKTNEAAIEKLKIAAQKHMDSAVLEVVNAVIEEI